uniref:Uncharacterized protein n=1 Tax=Rhizophora mucronata TaxID=61149 RepID=A0A2P2PB62_RHIMU
MKKKIRNKSEKIFSKIECRLILQEL